MGNNFWYLNELRSVDRYADQVALKNDAGEMSYASLLELSGRLYRRFNNVAGPFIPGNGLPLGIICTGSFTMYAWFVAALQNKITIVPIPAEWPAERIIKLKTLLGIQWFVEEEAILPVAEWMQNRFNATSEPEWEQNELPGPPGNEYSNIAYVLFTSGSTGTPKAVPVTHENLNAFLRHMLSRKEYALTGNDRFLQTYDPYFDVFYFSFLFSLLSGACLCLLKPNKSTKAIRILQSLKEYDCTVVSMVPTVLQLVAPLLPRLSLPFLRLSFFSGAILYEDTAERWQRTAPEATIINSYGPTETTIVCSAFNWSETPVQFRSMNGMAGLGKPFDGTDFLILDEKGIPVPNGESGELWIAGEQVFPGYIGVQDQHSFATINGTTYYATGDLAIAGNNGLFFFAGRKDSQVKINGYRIELEEVNFHLKQLAGDSITIAPANNLQVRQLIGVIVDPRLTSGNYEQVPGKTTLEWINVLKQKIPAYMVPEKYFFTGPWPLNSNGKIDRIKVEKEIEMKANETNTR